MKLETLTMQEALEQGAAMPWALVRSLSQVTLGTPPAEFSQEELLEARFFDEMQEIRVFRGQGSLTAVKLLEDEDDSTMEETYEAGNGKFRGKLTLRHVLQADEDGQTYIAATRLVRWEGDEA